MTRLARSSAPGIYSRAVSPMSFIGRALAASAIVFLAASGPAVPAGTDAPAAAATAAGVPSCASSGLVVWLDTQPGHAAGSTYYRLEFTNLSGRACTLRGYPGVSAVAMNRRRLGAAAARNPVHPSRPVTLRQGASATAVLQITDVHNLPQAACRPVTAAACASTRRTRGLRSSSRFRCPPAPARARPTCTSRRCSSPVENDADVNERRALLRALGYTP